MDFSGDKKTYSIDDQFMFGPAIMVCPVTEYMLHRPPENSVLITPEHFRTKDGQPGLTAKYYSDDHFRTFVTKQVETEHQSVLVHRLAGLHHQIPNSPCAGKASWFRRKPGRYRFHLKSFGPKRVFLDGKELPNNYFADGSLYRSGGTPGRQGIRLCLRDRQFGPGRFQGPAVSGRLRKFSPAKKSSSRRPQTRPVYLPAETQWIDFWTGADSAGRPNHHRRCAHR